MPKSRPDKDLRNRPWGQLRELCALMANRLRQSTPVVGILSEAERLAILRADEKAAA